MTELMDVELIELVSLVSEIDYENDGFQLLQRAGAMAFNDLVDEFTRTGTCKNKALLALVFVRLADLQVRDYAMGFTTTENIETVSSMWRWLLEIAPSGQIAPVAALHSAISYEQGKGEIALASLALPLMIRKHTHWPYFCAVFTLPIGHLRVLPQCERTCIQKFVPLSLASSLNP